MLFRSTTRCLRLLFLYSCASSGQPINQVTYCAQYSVFLFFFLFNCCCCCFFSSTPTTTTSIVSSSQRRESQLQRLRNINSIHLRFVHPLAAANLFLPVHHTHCHWLRGARRMWQHNDQRRLTQQDNKSPITSHLNNNQQLTVHSVPFNFT